MKILITGATGLLGNNLVRLALEDGHRVVALYRSKEPPASLRGLEVGLARGDINDLESLRAAAVGVDAILHSAAFIHIGWTKAAESERVNVAGTMNVASVAEAVGARLVHVSTVNTLAIGDRQGNADEETVGDGQVPCNYVVSKRGAERVTLAAAERGVHASVVHPGFMLGPWDWKPSSGRMVLQVGKYWTPLAPSGGCSVCDVRDVARGVLLTMEKGRAGRRYILAGENVSYLNLWKIIAKRFGKAPPWTIMRWPARWLVGGVGDLAARLTGRETDINSAALRMSSQFHCYSSRRANEELGYQSRGAEEAVAAAYAWFESHGYLVPSGQPTRSAR
jgi:dihydroflavonol-4-reductase